MNRSVLSDDEGPTGSSPKDRLPALLAAVTAIAYLLHYGSFPAELTALVGPGPLQWLTLTGALCCVVGLFRVFTRRRAEAAPMVRPLLPLWPSEEQRGLCGVSTGTAAKFAPGALRRAPPGLTRASAATSPIADRINQLYRVPQPPGRAPTSSPPHASSRPDPSPPPPPVGIDPHERISGAVPLGGLLFQDDETELKGMEKIKFNSEGLLQPLSDEMNNEERFVTKDAEVVLKYHGAYQQSNRDKREKGAPKPWTYMLRLKMPCGECPPDLYKELDDMADEMGQGDLRATTRQAWQMHGIVKQDLKEVVSTIMKLGGSTIAACGDVSRNVTCPPPPFVDPSYAAAREYAKVMAELLKPESDAFTSIWLDGEKVAEVEYWRKDIDDKAVIRAREHDSGTGIILPNDGDGAMEPLYGKQYLPRKFKIGVTVPGDNSIDIYSNDIGLVVVMDEGKQDLVGFNVMVGGGLGRTHNKETTFARAADHLGYVAKEDIMELCKAILATQRDYGNREVRANARMKYLVHTLGIDGFRGLVESYYGKKVQQWRDIGDWQFHDWLGWHEQGDGKLFLGLNVDNGRVKNDGDMRLKTLMRVLVDKFDAYYILTPSQSIIIKDIDPANKLEFERVIQEHGVQMADQIEPMLRSSMACPALPTCGLAMTEAERVMPTFVEEMRGMLVKHGLPDANIMMRMTGCPNGCARPYMAELAFVGDGQNQYQMWVGGSPVLEGRTNFLYKAKVKTHQWTQAVEPLIAMWKANLDLNGDDEAFGDFCHRVGAERLNLFAEAYTQQQRDATSEHIRALKLDGLKAGLRELGLPVSGKKAELLDRLMVAKGI